MTRYSTQFNNNNGGPNIATPIIIQRRGKIRNVQFTLFGMIVAGPTSAIVQLATSASYQAPTPAGTVPTEVAAAMVSQDSAAGQQAGGICVINSICDFAVEFGVTLYVNILAFAGAPLTHGLIIIDVED